MRLLVRRGPLAVEAALALVGATLAVKLMSRSRVAHLLGQTGGAQAAPSGFRDSDARLVGRAVARVAERLPWHPTCLPQAIATRWMLRRRGIASEAHLGVVRTDPFEAHAWVTVRGTVVQGGPVDHVTELVPQR